MSTQNEVNGAFPYYVNYYLHQNSVAIGELGGFSLSYENNEYTIVYWGYPSVNQPTMVDLQTYTLSEVMTFNQACQDFNQLAASTVPLVLSEAREIAVGNLGDGLPQGALVWCTDDASMHVWDGTQWKTLAFQQ